MPRVVCGAAVVGVLLLLAGCGDRLVELPVDRAAAVPVQLATGELRCPADTVLAGDRDPESGAGAVPTDFEPRTVLRCEADYSRATSRAGVDRLPVHQWQAASTPQLLTALNLPNREIRPRVACASGETSSTAVYLVDRQRRAVRMSLPHDSPCQRIRSEVVALLPANGGPADATFTVTRASR